MTNQIFSWQQAILQDEHLANTTRHLLLTLACYMNSMGESCYPSVRTLAKVTKLSARTIITHVEIAIERGFIRKDVHGFKGQKWKRNEYVAVMPVKNGCKNDDNCQGGAIGSPPFTAKGGERAASPSGVKMQKGGATDDKKVVKEVHTNRPLDLTSLSSSIGYVERGDNFLKNEFADNSPPQLFFENDVLDFPDGDLGDAGDEFENPPTHGGNGSDESDGDAGSDFSMASQVVENPVVVNPTSVQPTPPVQPAEQEVEEVLSICPKRKQAFEFIALHYQLDNQYFDRKIIQEPYALEDVDRALRWAEAGIEPKFVNHVMQDRLHKRKMAGRGAVVNFKMWDKFMIDEFKAAVDNGDYVTQSSKKLGDGGLISKPPLDLDNVAIKITNQRLQKALEHLYPANRIEHCRAEMVKLRDATWWQQAMEVMERKFGAAVRAAWFDQICPVMLFDKEIQNAGVLVVYAPSAFIASRINEQYGYHLQAALNLTGITCLRIETTH